MAMTDNITYKVFFTVEGLAFLTDAQRDEYYDDLVNALKNKKFSKKNITQFSLAPNTDRKTNEATALKAAYDRLKLQGGDAQHIANAKEAWAQQLVLVEAEKDVIRYLTGKNLKHDNTNNQDDNTKHIYINRLAKQPTAKNKPSSKGKHLSLLAVPNKIEKIEKGIFYNTTKVTIFKNKTKTYESVLENQFQKPLNDYDEKWKTRLTAGLLGVLGCVLFIVITWATGGGDLLVLPILGGIFVGTVGFAETGRRVLRWFNKPDVEFKVIDDASVKPLESFDDLLKKKVDEEITKIDSPPQRQNLDNDTKGETTPAGGITNDYSTPDRTNNTKQDKGSTTTIVTNQTSSDSGITNDYSTPDRTNNTKQDKGSTTTIVTNQTSSNSGITNDYSTPDRTNNTKQDKGSTTTIVTKLTPSTSGVHNDYSTPDQTGNTTQDPESRSKSHTISSPINIQSREKPKESSINDYGTPPSTGNSPESRFKLLYKPQKLSPRFEEVDDQESTKVINQTISTSPF